VITTGGDFISHVFHKATTPSVPLVVITEELVAAGLWSPDLSAARRQMTGHPGQAVSHCSFCRFVIRAVNSGDLLPAKTVPSIVAQERSTYWLILLHFKSAHYDRSRGQKWRSGQSLLKAL
jgi:hypothetical protein